MNSNSEQNNTNNITVETEHIITEVDNVNKHKSKKQRNIFLKLRENPTTGYSWHLTVSDGLGILSDK